MEFSDRLAKLRMQRGLTQQQLADRVHVHVMQITRYESRVNRPTIDVIKRLSIALSVSVDTLLFDENEVGPDDDFRLLFDGLRALTDHERCVVSTVLEAMLLKHRMSEEEPTARAIGKVVSLTKTVRKGNRGD
ncbi:helix-turn-helix domain-containing protein [Burkholderia ubonensis]|uniref:helix-turn-helix domain-containing protein n=1 Tax=Burkholderia ubonensis TaxID=101571 RepID=UPI0009B3840B|nr:helix-turn-helix transcriptional regulator [Burkholderia ubonensis]